MNPKWTSRFELKPGRWVFVPTPEAAAAGKKIKKQVESVWNAPQYYFHLQAGGHVAALRSHLTHTNFIHVDIEDFFGSVNRTRITRCLKPRVGYAKAREWANASTVAHPNDKSRFIIPYGFVQSQIVAALCLSESALGVCLDKIHNTSGVVVSVYVDDIIASTDDPTLCSKLFGELEVAASRARFAFNPNKQQGPGTSVTAFNIALSKDQLLIEADRLTAFSAALAQAKSEPQRQGILSYINSINPAQSSAV